MEQYRAFQADYVYVDRGHGSMQCEELSKFFFSENKPNIFKAVDFSSNYPFADPFTGETVNKRMKVMMIYFLQKRFEFREIAMSREEELKPGELVEQLNNYAIARYDNRDQPIFDGSLKGDHTLDGLMLAVFAFMENFASVFVQNGGVFVSTIARSREELLQPLEENFLQEQKEGDLAGKVNPFEMYSKAAKIDKTNRFILKKKTKKVMRGVDSGFF
jgi:hypothetical protein